jgi:hypothetical protein
VTSVTSTYALRRLSGLAAVNRSGARIGGRNKAISIIFMQPRYTKAERKDQGLREATSLDANTNKVGYMLSAQSSSEAEQSHQNVHLAVAFLQVLD